MNNRAAKIILPRILTGMQQRPWLPRSMPMRIAAWQITIGFAGALAWGLLSGPQDAVAAMTGGVIGAGLTLIFGFYVFRRRASDDPRGVVFALFKGAAMKLGLAAILFALAAKSMPDHYLALLSTFIPGLTGYWAALLWLRPGERWTK